MEWAPFRCEMCGSWVNDEWLRFWDAVALWVALEWYDTAAYQYEENQIRILHAAWMRRPSA